MSLKKYDFFFWGENTMHKNKKSMDRINAES